MIERTQALRSNPSFTNLEDNIFTPQRPWEGIWVQDGSEMKEEGLSLAVVYNKHFLIK